MNGQTVIIRGDTQRALAKRLIDAAPADAVLQILAPTRTNQQNAAMWAKIADVARAKPDGRLLPSSTWKCLFLDSAGFKFKWIPSLDGDGVVPIGHSSSRLRKAEMSDVLECINAFGARHNIRWSDTASQAA